VLQDLPYTERRQEIGSLIEQRPAAPRPVEPIEEDVGGRRGYCTVLFMSVQLVARAHSEGSVADFYFYQ
jgi:hypothetical protein